MLAIVFTYLGVSAQIEEANYIVLTNGIHVKAKKIKVHEKWVKYQPDCKGCITPHLIRPINVDTILSDQGENIVILKVDETNRIPFSGSKSSADTIKFFNNKNEKEYSLFNDKKVKFSTSSNKYRGYIRSVDGNQIGFSRQRKLKKVDSLTLISSTDVVRYKIKKSNAARFAGTLLKLPGMFAVYLGVGAAITLLNDVGILLPSAVTAGGAALYYWGTKVSTRKIIIGNKWQMTQR